jgi:hypothetical protein
LAALKNEDQKIMNESSQRANKKGININTALLQGEAGVWSVYAVIIRECIKQDSTPFFVPNSTYEMRSSRDVLSVDIWIFNDWNNLCS